MCVSFRQRAGASVSARAVGELSGRHAVTSGVFAPIERSVRQTAPEPGVPACPAVSLTFLKKIATAQDQRQRSPVTRGALDLNAWRARPRAENVC